MSKRNVALALLTLAFTAACVVASVALVSARFDGGGAPVAEAEADGQDGAIDGASTDNENDAAIDSEDVILMPNTCGSGPLWYTPGDKEHPPLVDTCIP